MTERDDLARLYQVNKYPVAFLDESFEMQLDETFYIVAVAVVFADALGSTREALSGFYGGDPLHAGPMFANRELDTLRQATSLVASQNDAMDIIVCAPIGAEDVHGDIARAKCLSFAFEKVHCDFGTELFILDSASTPTKNELDKRTLNDIRRGGRNPTMRQAVAHHCRPSLEPLLGLPDIAAWAYRQEHARGDTSWFEPLRGCTEVSVI